MLQRLAIGIDIGGTKVAAGVVDEDGVVLAQEPAGGASRPKGSVVTITIGLFG